VATLESLIVALIVIACAVFSVWRLLSARLRLRLIDALPRSLGAAERGWRGRIRQKTLASLSGGCGTCAKAPRVVNPPAHASQPARLVTRRSDASSTRSLGP